MRRRRNNAAASPLLARHEGELRGGLDAALLEVRDHGADVGVLGPRLEELETHGGGAPLEDLDLNIAAAPGAHGGSAGHKEVDGLAPDQGGAVVLNHVGAAGAWHPKAGAEGHP